MSFPRYPAYKDAGIEWLGEVPKHWQVKRLRHIAQLNPGKSEVQRLSPDTLVTFLPMEAIGEQGDLDRSSHRELADVLDGYTYVRDGDVVFAKITPCFENGKAALIDGLRNGVGFGTTELTVLRPRLAQIHGNYLFRVIQSEPFRSIGTSEMYGAGGQKRVPDNFARNFSIGLPSLHEQAQITTFLNHETARIDGLIEEQQRLIDLLQEKRNAIVYEGMHHPDTAYVRLSRVVDCIARPVVPDSEKTYVPLGLYNRARGYFLKEPRLGNELGESDFFWVRAGDLVISGQFAWEGAVALMDESADGCIVSHRYPVIRGENGVLSTAYLLSLLSTEFGDALFDEHSRGAAGRNRPLNLGSLLKEDIPLPPMSLQEQCSRIVHVQREVMENAEEQSKFLREHRAALISAAVTGKIDVRGWKPQNAPMESELPHAAETEAPYG